MPTGQTGTSAPCRPGPKDRAYPGVAVTDLSDLLASLGLPLTGSAMPDLDGTDGPDYRNRTRPPGEGGPRSLSSCAALKKRSLP